MFISQEPPHPSDEIIVISGRSDIDFWCRRFSISPFTLFQLLKTVGNDARQIGEFLHKNEGERLDIGEPKKSISIL
jgi:hypothetical protein